jgi:hypothetical protein
MESPRISMAVGVVNQPVEDGIGHRPGKLTSRWEANLPRDVQRCSS